MAGVLTSVKHMCYCIYMAPKKLVRRNGNIYKLHLKGYSHKAIAGIFHITPTAANMVIVRMNKALALLKEAEDIKEGK